MSYKDLTRNYRYSYSGSDARAYCYFEGRGDLAVLLESLHTISWSVHEATGDVRALGYRGVKGFTKGVRLVAGSLITTVVEDHPLAAVMDLLAELRNDPVLRWPSWSVDKDLIGVGSGIDNTTYTRRLAPTLPPINILVQYVAEGSAWVDPDPDAPTSSIQIPGAAVLLRDVVFIDESLVTSTSDAASEMTYSFKAYDCKTLSKQQFEAVRTGNLSVGASVVDLATYDQQLRGVLFGADDTLREAYMIQAQEQDTTFVDTPSRVGS